jgi:DNA-binding transcriptional MerR regulator
MAAHAPTESIAVLTGRPEPTIRYWAHRGWLTRRGTGPHGRALYDVDEAQELAAKLAALDKPADLHQHQDHSQESAHQAHPG